MGFDRPYAVIGTSEVAGAEVDPSARWRRSSTPFAPTTAASVPAALTAIVGRTGAGQRTPVGNIVERSTASTSVAEATTNGPRSPTAD